MIELDTVLLKTASRCNLNCTYCYVYNMGDALWADMPKQMPPSLIAAVSNALGELAHIQDRPFSVVLHGGEPLLVGQSGLEALLKSIRQPLPVTHPIGIQTNGALITNAILDTCARYRASLSVSIDGPKALHDRHRRSHDSAGSFDRTIAGIELLRHHPETTLLFSGVLAVVDPHSDPAEIYRFFKGLEVPSIDFLARDGNHTRLPYGKASFESSEYGQWTCELLEIYLADPRPPRIRFLDEMIRLVMCDEGWGNGRRSQNIDVGIIVIDTDGSFAKNDTLKSSYPGADRFRRPWSVYTDNLIDVLASDDFAEYHAMQRPTSQTCRICPDLLVCAGGMQVHRWSDATGYENPSIYCTDQRLLIARIRDRLAEVPA